MGFQSKFENHEVDQERSFYEEQFVVELRKEIEFLKSRLNQLELRLEDPFG